MITMTTPKISLKVVHAPPVGVVLDAPPVLVASEHSVDYTCGHCGTILLHAEEGQIRGVTFETGHRASQRRGFETTKEPSQGGRSAPRLARQGR